MRSGLLCTVALAALLALSSRPASAGDSQEVDAAVAQGLELRTQFRLGESIEVLKGAVATARAIPDPEREVAALDELGLTAYMWADWSTARDAFASARGLADAAGDADATARFAVSLGKTLCRTGGLEEALDLVQDAAAYFDEHGLRVDHARALVTLGRIHRDLHQTDLAEQVLQQALEMAPETEPALRAAAEAHLGVLDEFRRDYDAAEKHYRRALALDELAGDEQRQAADVCGLGYVEALRRNWDAATQTLDRAIVMAESSAHRDLIASCHNILAWVHGEAGRPDDAARAVAASIAARREIGDPVRLSGALTELAASHWRAGRTDEGLAAIDEALALIVDQPNSATYARSLTCKAMLLSAETRFEEAIEYEQRSLEMRQALDLPIAAGWSLNNLGGYLRDLGRRAEALARHAEAVEIGREHEDLKLRLYAETNAAWIRAGAGDLPRALEIYESALAAASEMHDLRFELRIASDVLAARRDLGDWSVLGEYPALAARAEKLGDIGVHLLVLRTWAQSAAYCGRVALHLEILERVQRVAAASTLVKEQARAAARYSLGLQMAGDTKAAAKWSAQAVVLADELDDPDTTVLVRAIVGANLWHAGKPGEALPHLQEADRIAMEVVKRGVNFDTKFWLAMALISNERPEDALGQLEHALEAAKLDEQRARALAAMGRASFLAGDVALARERHAEAETLAKDLHFDALRSQNTAWQLELELSEGNAEAALDAARRGARAFARLNRGLGDVHGVTSRSQRATFYRDCVRAGLASDDPEALFEMLEASRAGALVDALGSRDAVESATLPASVAEGLRAARARGSAAWARLRFAREGGQPAAIDDARTAAEAAEDDVVEWGERASRAARGGRTSIVESATLAQFRAVIDSDTAYVAIELIDGEIVALMVTRADARIIHLAATEAIMSASAAFRDPGKGAAIEGALAPLRSGVVERLQVPDGTRTLIVSPSGPFSFVPWSVLAGDRRVSLTPSATVYASLVTSLPPAGTGVLAFGDPDYRRREENVTASLLRGRALTALPGTRVEALGVGTDVMLGRDASETRLRALLGAESERRRAIHLACHGLVDADHPWMSALALAPDEEHDGMVRAVDLAQLHLSADLVALSACDTARGNAVEGEGVVGLARACMIGGAPRVLVSLWRVDDEATQALMTEFYRRFNASDGPRESAAAALRAAQASVRAQKKWAHPRFWAAWQLWGVAD